MTTTKSARRIIASRSCLIFLKDDLHQGDQRQVKDADLKNVDQMRRQTHSASRRRQARRAPPPFRAPCGRESGEKLRSGTYKSGTPSVWVKNHVIGSSVHSSVFTAAHASRAWVSAWSSAQGAAAANCEGRGGCGAACATQERWRRRGGCARSAALAQPASTRRAGGKTSLSDLARRRAAK